MRMFSVICRLHVVAALVAALGAGGCGEFEVPSVVLDLRVLAMRAEPPEVVIPVTLEELPALAEDPARVQEILEDLPDVEVCALIADPADSRALEFTLRACAPTDNLRCDEAEAAPVDIASGTVEDPEEAATPVVACGTLAPSLSLFLVLQEALENDPLAGFGGVPAMVELSVRPAGAPLEEAQYAVKRVTYSVDHPPGRVANQNPSLAAVAREIGEDQTVAMPLGRCGDFAAPTLRPEDTLNFVPEEAMGAREEYTVATFDGGTRTFTENLTYWWYATGGSWQRHTTGGPRDVAGNDPPLDSEWTPPSDLDGPREFQFWVVQRDERGGASWYQSCARVEP